MINNKKFIYLGFSSIFIVSIFFNFFLIFNNKRQNKKAENVVVDKKDKTVVKKDTLSTLLFTVDKERQDYETCGYKYDDIVDNLVLSKNQQANARFENGVWANDCQIYAYAIKLMQPAVQTSSAEEKLWGIWTYDPIKKENKQIYNSPLENPYPIVYRFVASDIISAAGKLINTKTGQVITTLSSTEWVKYRDPAFPWIFSYPREWRIATEEAEYFPEEENLTIKKLVIYSGKFRIEFLNYLPEFDKSKYSDNYANVGSKYGYIYYHGSKLSLDPSDIYLYQNDDQKYPPVITITDFNDPSGVYVKNLF
ncbi:hypothetical protein L6272_03460, partial [Microgenomates group bacterium]|nr:hypothetical protein [Microgenomates group bacterium]